uniref:Uncharacterized protein n=1 Tax=Onchocerca volvulus TaxID=6282 RepID=A0A8R1TUF0_ONCVO
MIIRKDIAQVPQISSRITTTLRTQRIFEEIANFCPTILPEGRLQFLQLSYFKFIFEKHLISTFRYDIQEDMISNAGHILRNLTATG